MAGIHISEHFGIVIRKAALAQHLITHHQILAAMEAEAPMDEDTDLLSFGPHFGDEAGHTFIQRLEQLSLVYGDDFIDLALVVPEWWQLMVALRPPLSDNI